MPYYSAPSETLVSWQEMQSWATGAVDASRRAKTKSKNQRIPATRYRIDS
jgi:TfoX/Sxy family transcriptional regulator of competence genes